MDYNIQTKSYVNKVFIFPPPDSKDSPVELLNLMSDERDVPDGEILIFNGKIPLEWFKSTEITVGVLLLAYGDAGGRAEYQLKDLISIPMSQTTSPQFESPIILNLPHNTQHALIEYPGDLQELLGLPKYAHCMRLDLTNLRKQHALSDESLRGRGIDPTQATWTSMMSTTLPEWGLERLTDLCAMVDKSRLVKVHCFSFTKLQKITIKKA